MIKPTIAGKVIKLVTTRHLASMLIIDLWFTDNTHYFVKAKQGVVEMGGTADWGTGEQS